MASLSSNGSLLSPPCEFQFLNERTKDSIFLCGFFDCDLGSIEIERIRDYRLRSIASICYSVIEGDLDMIIYVFGCWDAVTC